jgi:hypothetical protein
MASPFTHKSKRVRDMRAKLATKAAIDLLKHNIMVFAPIPYNANWTRNDSGGLPVEWSFWETYDKNFLHRCDGLIILQLEGWNKSVGVTAETQYAREIGLPIFKLSPKDIDKGNLKKIRQFIDKRSKKRKKPKKH